MVTMIFFWKMHVSRRHGPTKRGVVKGCGHMILKHCIIGQCQTGVLVSSILSLSSLLRPSILGQTRQCSNISPDSCCRGNLILCELMCVSAVIVVYCWNKHTHYQLEQFLLFSFPSSSSSFPLPFSSFPCFFFLTLPFSPPLLFPPPLLSLLLWPLFIFPSPTANMRCYFVGDQPLADPNMTVVLPCDVESTLLSWGHSEVVEIHRRRHMLKNNALEIFLINGKTMLLAFNSTRVNKIISSVLCPWHVSVPSHNVPVPFHTVPVPSHTVSIPFHSCLCSIPLRSGMRSTLNCCNWTCLTWSTTGRLSLRN